MRSTAAAALFVLAVAGCATAIGLHDLVPPAPPPDDPAVCARTQTIAPVTTPFCANGGSCWQNPAPTGANLYHAWGACGDAWVVGKGGELVHWDGTAFTEVPSGVTADLFRISGTSPTDVWFAGDVGTMLHWDGTSLKPVPLPADVVAPMIAVWASTPTDAWALGAVQGGTTFLHWDGTSWSHVADRETTGLLYNALWGSSPTDVWAVGAAGTASHWDGKAWRESRSTGTGDLTHVWGSGPTDVWATSDAPSMQHWDGVAWATADVGLDTSETPTDVWGGTSDDIWLASDTTLRHYDGTSWHVAEPSDGGAPIGPDVSGGWSLGSGQTLMVGKSGLLVHGNGESLMRIGTGYRKDVNAIWGTSSSDVWIVGAAGFVGYWNGSMLTPHESSTAAQNAVWGDGLGPVWIAGDNGMRQFPGPNDTFPLDGAVMTAVWGSGSGVVWAAGLTTSGAAIYTYDDRATGDGGAPTWTKVPLDLTSAPDGLVGFNALHGTSADDVWAVGNVGAVAHWDGKTWKVRSAGNGDPLLSSVLAVAPSDVWVAGHISVDRTNTDVVLHYDGKAWTGVNGPFDGCSCVPTCELACGGQQRLWAKDGDKHPFLSSSHGTIHQWDGSAWKLVAAGSGTTRAFYGTPTGANALLLWSGGPGGAVRTIRP